MKEIFGKRLLHARKQAGLSQDELVALIDGKVKKTAIAKYERGEMMADTAVVEALAKALNQQVDYFYRPFSVQIGDIAFRAKASMGSRKAESLKHRITAHIERYVELEQLMNAFVPFENPLPGTVISTAADMDNAASALYDAWNLGSEGIGSVLGLLEDKGVKIFEIEADEDFSGFSATIDGKSAAIGLQKNNTTTERKRFTALHELAHILFSFDPALTDHEKEKLCNRFAGAMLLPGETLRREVGRFRSAISPFELGLIKDKYGISASAIVVRTYQCGIISSFVEVSLLRYARRTPMETHIGSNNRTDRATRFELLLSRAIAEHIISKNKALELSLMNPDDFNAKYYADDYMPDN